MKKYIAPLLALALTVNPKTAVATESVQLADAPTGLGIGVILGEPTGLSMIVRNQSAMATSAAMAWSVPESKLQLHGDLQFKMVNIHDPNAPSMSFPLHTGIGLRLRLAGNPGADNFTGPADLPVQIGVRMPLGLSLLPDDYPLDAFIELVPVIGIFPATNFDLDAAIGFRAFFGN